jgi:sortase A
VRHVVSGIGKVLVTLGILILLFVAYQLWGTGIYTARAQNQLEKDFQSQLDRAGVTPTTIPGRTTGSTPTTVPVVTTLPPVAPPDPADGDVLAHLVIPKIGTDSYVVQGTADADLRKGPGHYPATPLPGQVGNSAIAGHRTTYGAPFGELDSLEVGDVIQVTTLQGNFEYHIYDKFVVSPNTSEVLDPDPSRPAIITLTTCHPKYSAQERLIVQAELIVPSGGQPLASTVDLSDPDVRKAELADSLSGDSGPILPTIIAGLFLAIVGALWWLLFHRHPRWTTWFIGVVPFAIILAIFYYLLERALPANY